MRTNRILAAALIALSIQSPVLADVVEVEVTGTVTFNMIAGAPLNAVSGGDAVTITFRVDSNNYLDGVPGDTRGYEIIQSSFSIDFDTPVSMGLLNPFPGGQTPYFTLVDGFPVSDGFFVSTSPFSPGGVPLAQTPFNLNHSLGYVGSTLGSLDILSALGTYDFTGMTSFGLDLWSGFPDNVAMGIDFTQMTLALVGGQSVFCDSNPNNAATIAADTTSCAAGSIQITMTGAPVGQPGYLLIGAGSATITDPAGALGDLCLGGAAIGRYTKDLGVTDGSGSLSTDILNAISGGGGGAIPNPPGGNLCSPLGQTWNFQYWHRDGASPSKFSQALSVTFM